MVDLKKIGQFFTDRGLWEKAFVEFSKKEILDLATTFFSSPGGKVPPEGWKKPFINGRGVLVIPSEAHPKYRWWTMDGQSILNTLDELGASDEVKARYLPTGYGEGQAK